MAYNRGPFGTNVAALPGLVGIAFTLGTINLPNDRIAARGPGPLGPPCSLWPSISRAAPCLIFCSIRSAHRPFPSTSHGYLDPPAIGRNQRCDPPVPLEERVVRPSDAARTGGNAPLGGCGNPTETQNQRRSRGGIPVRMLSPFRSAAPCANGLVHSAQREYLPWRHSAV
jgi:hypothetical protein